MKIKKLLAVAAALTLSGCSGSAKENFSGAGKNAEDAVSQDSNGSSDSRDEVNGDIAVLSIKTKNQSADVMDFVTEPVASHVAKDIASWTPGYKMPPAPYYEECTITLTGADNKVLLDSAEAKVKVRGNWTTTYKKKPLRIKFTERQNLLGLNDGAEMKNWVLLAEYKDASMLRDKTALSIAQEILGEDGLYAADAEFVEVEINDEYWGVYLLSELQQINENRVNITEAAKDYTGTDIGYFMEYDGYYVNEEPLQSFFVDYADNAPLVPFDGNGGSGKTITCLSERRSDGKKDVGITIKSDIYSQAQHDFIEDYVNNAYRIMYSAAYEDKAYVFSDDYTKIVEDKNISPQEAVEKAVDVNSLADVYIINEIACDADIYWSSFFMDADFGEGGSRKLTFEAPWDYDSGMGNKDRCADGQGFYAANIVPDVNNVYETVNPWLAVLMYEDWFQDIIRDKWTDAYDSGVFDRAYTMIETDTAQYQDAFERNYQKWNNILDKSEFANELSRKAAKCKTHAEAAEYLKEWLQSRVEFLNDYWHD